VAHDPLAVHSKFFSVNMRPLPRADGVTRGRAPTAHHWSTPPYRNTGDGAFAMWSPNTGVPKADTESTIW
jgi:hypothetical protein